VDIDGQQIADRAVLGAVEAGARARGPIRMRDGGAVRRLDIVRARR
jgi:hypothetical protein